MVFGGGRGLRFCLPCYPGSDGYYNYDEEMYTVALAYQACTSKATDAACQAPAVNQMWAAWQGRRLHPDHTYGGYELLSMWSGYIVHLVYYTTHAFNSDPVLRLLLAAAAPKLLRAACCSELCGSSPCALTAPGSVSWRCTP